MICFLTSEIRAVDYFPLNIGDWWIYEEEQSEHCPSQTTMDWRRVSYFYYEIINSYSCTDSCIYYDSIYIAKECGPYKEPPIIDSIMTCSGDTIKIAVKDGFIWKYIVMDFCSYEQVVDTIRAIHNGTYAQWIPWPLAHDYPEIGPCTADVMGKGYGAFHIDNFRMDRMFIGPGIPEDYRLMEVINGIGLLNSYCFYPGILCSYKVNFNLHLTSLRGDSLPVTIGKTYDSELRDENCIKVYPNPFSNNLKFFINTANFSNGNYLKVYSSNGVLVRKFHFPPSVIRHIVEYDTRDLPSGIYTFVLHDKDKRITRRAVLVK